ncbi:MAG: PhzF family phenazine biosynthesis protein [Bradyrhizobium sp.]|nr:PhzF family phenazine biosynthesis protein [Bradyrhizobium sp.]
MKCDVTVVAAFLKDGLGGNPAAVVAQSAPLSDRQMQSIATTMNLSETAFISEVAPSRYRCWFYTPVRQIAYCGHATIAAFWHLWNTAQIQASEVVLETPGTPLRISWQDNAVYMQQQAPVFEDRLAAAYGVSLNEVQEALRIASVRPSGEVTPVIASTGLRFLLVPCVDETALSECWPNVEAMTELSERLDIVGFYPFALSSRDDTNVVSRMFAPAYGIPEEAATGMAAGSLACYLHAKRIHSYPSIRIEQGRHMEPSTPSEIVAVLDVSDGAISGIRVGGKGKQIGTRTVSV